LGWLFSLAAVRPLSLSSRLRVSPVLRSAQLPRSPRRRFPRCMAPMTGAQGRKPRRARAKRRGSGTSYGSDPAPYPVPCTAFPAASRRPRPAPHSPISGEAPRPRGTAAFVLPGSCPQDHSGTVNASCCQPAQGIPRSTTTSAARRRSTPGAGTSNPATITLHPLACVRKGTPNRNICVRPPVSLARLPAARIRHAHDMNYKAEFTIAATVSDIQAGA